MFQILNSTYKPICIFCPKYVWLDLNKRTFLSAENIRDKLQRMNSEMKEMKERLDTLTASLEVNKDEGQL